MPKTFYVVGVFAALLAALPATTFAYRASEATAVRVTDTHVLFTIPFTAGFLNRTSLTPIMASTNTARKGAVIVSIENMSGVVSSVPVQAIVLDSDLKRTRSHYIVPEGSRGTFKLIAVAEIPKGETEYRLVVDKFPYLLVDDESVLTATAVATPFIEAFVTPTVR